MNSNTIKTYALIGTSIASVVLLYRYLYVAGVSVGLQRSRTAAINSAHKHLQNIYRDRVNNLLDICSNSGMPEADLEAVIDIVDRPL